MKNYKVVIVSILPFFSPYICAEEADKRKWVKEFDFDPVILDSDSNAKSTIGINYELKGDPWLHDFSSGDGGSPIIGHDAPIEKGKLSYSLKGTLAVDKESNPKNFLESRVDFGYFRSTSFTLDVGMFYEYESDQSFDNTQNVLGFSALVLDYDFLGNNNWIALYVNYGEVDPKDDKAREAVLGNQLETYNRWELEALYSVNIGTKNLDSLEINLRYFMEDDAPAVIETADLDVFKLATIKLMFRENLYLAYSSGNLPFDKESDQIAELGFSYKFN